MGTSSLDMTSASVGPGNPLIGMAPLVSRYEHSHDMTILSYYVDILFSRNFVVRIFKVVDFSYLFFV